MKIIAFVGMPASGKGEAAEVAGNMDYPLVNMGNVIREEVERLGLEPTDENLGGTGTRLRQEEGLSAIARRCVPKLRAFDADTAVVDGVRNIEEVHLFKEEFGEDFLLINIDSSIQNRLRRIQMRGRSDDKLMDEEALRIRDERELGWGMGESINNADMTINNNGSLEEFRDKVSQFIGEIR
ncbi:MAG: flagellar hook-basal body complex protein FliE [Methanosarcinales archaeon]|nr:flagellar hook-basal body complex protein FliE [Methanosarcinales archaeon]